MSCVVTSLHKNSPKFVEFLCHSLLLFNTLIILCFHTSSRRRIDRRHCAHYGSSQQLLARIHIPSSSTHIQHKFNVEEFSTNHNLIIHLSFDSPISKWDSACVFREEEPSNNNAYISILGVFFFQFCPISSVPRRTRENEALGINLSFCFWM